MIPTPTHRPHTPGLIPGPPPQPSSGHRLLRLGHLSSRGDPNTDQGNRSRPHIGQMSSLEDGEHTPTLRESSPTAPHTAHIERSRSSTQRGRSPLTSQHEPLRVVLDTHTSGVGQGTFTVMSVCVAAMPVTTVCVGLNDSANTSCVSGRSMTKVSGGHRFRPDLAYTYICVPHPSSSPHSCVGRAKLAASLMLSFPETA